MSQKFSLGQVVATPNALEALKGVELFHFVSRHAQGDWGEVDKEDWAANDRALKEGDRLLSAYSVNGVKFWIITEWDRSVTTILLPEDY